MMRELTIPQDTGTQGEIRLTVMDEKVQCGEGMTAPIEGLLWGDLDNALRCTASIRPADRKVVMLVVEYADGSRRLWNADPRGRLTPPRGTVILAGKARAWRRAAP